jgi:hypothetical protein
VTEQLAANPLIQWGREKQNLCSPATMMANAWPFTCRKTDLLEGRLRVPAIVRWPMKINSGQKSEQFIATLDWVPTILSAVGLLPHRDSLPDGMDMLPTPTGEPSVVVWRFKFMAKTQCGTATGSTFVSRTIRSDLMSSKTPWSEQTTILLDPSRPGRGDRSRRHLPAASAFRTGNLGLRVPQHLGRRRASRDTATPILRSAIAMKVQIFEPPTTRAAMPNSELGKRWSTA